jgi:SnoaL-like polyketide cyclase
VTVDLRRPVSVAMSTSRRPSRDGEARIVAARLMLCTDSIRASCRIPRITPACRALAAPAYRYEEATSGRRIDDIDAVVADWRRLRAVFPDVDAEIVDVLAHGDTSVIGLVWRATHTTPVHTPAGPQAPSYKRIRIGDSVSLTWGGGRLVTERHQLGFLSVLAALPAFT